MSNPYNYNDYDFYEEYDNSMSDDNFDRTIADIHTIQDIQNLCNKIEHILLYSEYGSRDYIDDALKSLMEGEINNSELAEEVIKT